PLRMQGGGGADVEDVVFLTGEQRGEPGLVGADRVFFGKTEPGAAPRGNRRHLRVEPVYPLIGVHMQLGDKAASDKAHSDFRHRRAPSRESSSYCLRPCAKALGGAVRRRPRRLVRIAAPTRRSQHLLKNTIDSWTTRTIRARTLAKRTDNFSL